MRVAHPRHRLLSPLTILVIVLATSLLPAAAPGVVQANPGSVTIAGSLQSEAGCPGDWDPACAATHLTLDAADDVWQGTFSLPAGGYEYKAALDDSWDVNYGLHATPGGANIPLTLGADTAVKFYYDDKTHWVTDNANSIIATVPGSFQSELGCPGDWDPGCLRSWLQDPDGDGVYAFSTTALPAGSYEGKVAINESWDENYGVGGVPGGPNYGFTVPAAGIEVTFSYDPTSHILTISLGNQSFPDNNVEWEGLRHDSRDPLYRTPGGAVPAGTPVTLRLRTYHNDVTAVQARVYNVAAAGASVLPMTPAATDVSCYEEGLEARTCDFWAVTLPNAVPDNLWYRFIITDGSDTDYYADNTPALDGGLGAPSDDPVDNSYALTVYDPAFTAPAWAKDAVIYQIFPDRFRNGSARLEPHTGDIRYDDPVIALPWGTLPEGYCRNYADAATHCPWRFDTTPPADSPTKEQPRGRDYFGGDLPGVIEKLDYLRGLGVTAIYFNPVFEAKSNHRYDTAEYFKIDPYLGYTKGEFTRLVKEADARGIRIILDGVFNHMSSDSMIFDRYHHYTKPGACEVATVPTRTWFTFRPPGPGDPAPCAASAAGGDTYYDGWFGFDSIPVLDKSNPQVLSYFVTGPQSVTRYWLNMGAQGWRMDVMGDASFPDGYWEAFRGAVKATNPNALIIGELWQKDSTLLKHLIGDRADTTMNYRLRDATIGLFAPGPFDSKGFADSGRPLLVSEFASRLASIREDYPDPVYYALMNLLDSHDTERLLWTLTPGTDTRADKEFNAANFAEGQRRAQLASLVQITVPGAPTIYYGDEVAMTGDDDPDDRRTYPWADTGGSPDATTFAHYQALLALRNGSEALRDGDFRVLMADDAAQTVAYGRKTSTGAAIVVINRSGAAQTAHIPLAGYIPDGVTFTGVYGVGNAGAPAITSAGGALDVPLAPMSAWLLLAEGVDLTPPAAPLNLQVTAEGAGEISLAWDAVAGAAGYNVYRSPVSSGGFVKVNTAPLAGTTYTDTGLENGQAYFYVVTAVDPPGNESAQSNEVSALPHLSIGWANLQWPPTLTHTISAVSRTANVYGQVWIDGATSAPGPTPTLHAQLGYGPAGSNPQTDPGWSWVEAAFNGDAGNNDEFVASLLPEATGSYHYVYRYTTTNGRDWLYADLNGPLGAGAAPANPGVLTVNPSGDTTPPAAPTGLSVMSASPAGIELGWDAVPGDPTLYGYEVRRSDTPGGPYTTLALTTDVHYTDMAVIEGATYYYVVRAVDLSFNRSPDSAEVAATAALRTVSVTFNVTAPATTDATGRTVYIAGSLNRLDGGLPEWDPGGVALARVDATHWAITLTGKETTAIEYKYALGAWDYVEKDSSCGEIGNRALTLSYGATGAQTVNDVVLNWRNVAPCGN